ncbi:MAG: LysR family transcriptional regulator substrate-binding protein, partial [Atopobiaceae bacterium]|nr:LysR family transcriptional regulator substrate-binding protein [Atopobiaceae bacterium]
GELLRQYAQEMTEISDKIEHDFAVLRSRPLGDIYVGGIDANLTSGIRLMSELRAERPDLIIHYRSCCSTDALALLDRGLLDFAIVSNQARVTHYETLRVTPACQWVAVIRRDNPLAQRDALTAADLCDALLLMYDQALKAPPELNDLAQWFGGDFSHLNVVATSNLTAVLYGFAGEGMGVLLTWENITHVGDYDVVSVPLEPAVTAWALLAWHKDRPLSPAATHALALTRAKAAEWCGR